MSDDFKIQVSFKVPVSNDNYRDSMVNVRADSAEELGELLDAVVLNASTIEDARQAVVGAVTITRGLPGAAVSATGGPETGAAEPGAEAGGATRIEGPDRFGRTFVWGDPEAPDVPSGPSQGQKAVKMQATSGPQSRTPGQPYEKWIDPGSKDVPSNFARGIKANPPGLWAGEYVK